MPKPQLKLAGDDTVDETKPRSPEREALAAALARRDEAQARVDAVRQAQNTALTAARTARDAVEAAEANVLVAQRMNAEALVSTALGKSGPARQTVREARQLVQDAKDDLAAAEDAQVELSRQLKTAETPLHLADNNLDRAYRAALAAEPAVHNLLAERETLNARLRNVDLALAAVWGAGGLPQYLDWPSRPEPFQFDINTIRQHVPDWVDAVEALREDANAVLPD